MMVRNISLTVLCVLAFFFVPVSTWSQSDHTARLVEGAKKEGKLLWYTNINVRDSRQILDLFERKYPFIKAEFFRVGGEQVINRILSKEFQEFSASSADRVSARTDVKPPSPDLDHKQLKIRTVPQDIAVRYNEYLQEFKNILEIKKSRN